MAHLASVSAAQAVGVGDIRGRAPDAATRHLCAAAYIDDDFRKDCLRGVYYQPRRMVAPSYGFDLIPVLRHCLRARNAMILRDAAIVAALVLAGLIRPVLLLVAFLLMASAYGVRGLRFLSNEVRTILAGWVLVAIIVAAGLFWNCGSVLDRSSFESGTPAIIVVVLIMVAIALPIASSLWRQRQVERIVRGTALNAPAPPRGRLAQIDWQQRGNTVIYAGYQTFIGSGPIITRWQPFTLPLVPRAGARASPARGSGMDSRITADQVISFVSEHLSSLQNGRSLEQVLPGLTVTGRIYQSGSEVLRLWPITSPDRIVDLIKSPTEPARHYLVCQVVSWQGELATTVYVHYAVQGDSLSVSLVATALLPCKEEYEAVDHVKRIGPRAYLHAFWRGLRAIPRTVAVAPMRLLGAVSMVLATSLWARIAAGRVASRGFRHGAHTSVRERGMAATTRNDIQWQEIQKYKWIIVRQVMAATLDFLDQRGVETGEFRREVINIITGGTVHTGSGDINETTIGRQENNFSPSEPAAR